MPDPNPGPRRWRFQFGLGTLLFVVFPVSLLAAALGGMLRPATAEDPFPRFLYLAMAVAAPLVVMIVASLLRAILRGPKEPRRD